MNKYFFTFFSDISVKSLNDHLPRNNPKRNPLSPILEQFLDSNYLECIDVTQGNGPTYTYEHKTLKNQSYIDHITLLKHSTISVDECIVEEKSSINMSDHQEITAKLTIECSPTPTLLSICDDEFAFSVPKYAWKDPNFQNKYRIEVVDRIESSAGGLKNMGTDAKIEGLHEILLQSGLAAFKSTFPDNKTAPFAKKWWTPQLTISKKVMTTHFNAWRDRGFPKDIDDVYYNRFVLARKNFRCAVKSAQNRMIAEKYMKINSLLQTDPRKFWKNMRNLKDSSQKRPFIINNKQTDEEITREFGDNFNTLLNNPKGKAVPHTRDLPSHSDEKFRTTAEDVKNAIEMLKEYKSNDTFGLAAEHFIYAGHEDIPSIISDIYNEMFESYNTSPLLGCATLIPLVKSYRKSLKSPNNYRGISLIPMLTKIMEYVILKKCPELTDSRSSQFGFTTNASTLHAEFIISETIQYYNSKGSPVYMCSLDAEKAFDSCNWSVLFEKLYYDKHIPLPVVKVLQSLYENGRYSVMYNGKRSYSFKASQGVFQGGILSPHLYNIYTEYLLKEVEEQSITGTSIHGTFSGIIAYADDIILLSPTLSGLQTLLNTCTQYFDTTAISLNVDKTEFLISHSNLLTGVHINLDHHLISPQNKLKHLGFLWSLRRNGRATLNDLNLQERLNKFWALIHSLIQGGIRFCHPSSIIELYRCLAVPTLTYGLELTHLTATQMSDLDTEGRKALKLLFNYSPYSKNYLHTYFNIKPISNTVNNNKINLLSRLMNNEATSNIILKTLQTSARYSSLIWDCYSLAQENELDFYVLLLNIKKLYIEYDSAPISEETTNCMKNCIRLWNIPEERRRFRDLLEARVPKKNQE